MQSTITNKPGPQRDPAAEEYQRLPLYYTPRLDEESHLA